MTALGGAGEISVFGRDYVGVGGGSVFTTPGWSPGAAGFDIDATAGAARVAVTARAASLSVSRPGNPGYVAHVARS